MVVIVSLEKAVLAPLRVKQEFGWNSGGTSLLVRDHALFRLFAHAKLCFNVSGAKTPERLAHGGRGLFSRMGSARSIRGDKKSKQ